MDSRLLPPTEDQYEELARWMQVVGPAGGSLIEIGSGDGDDSYFPLIRPQFSRIVGVDPDPAGSGHRGLDERHECTIEEFAARSGGGELFDTALAAYVLEHVAEPVAFLSAVRSVLRPGGSFFVVTPNLWHYFGLLAKGSALFGLEDRLLVALRSIHLEAHHDHAARHFPVAYRANSVRAIRRAAGAAGFAEVQIRHLENPAVFEAYFPGRSVAFPRRYADVVNQLAIPALFGTMICRFVP